MTIGRPVGRTQAQIAKAAATKRRAREFERATSSPAVSLGWKAPARASTVEFSIGRGVESLGSSTSPTDRSVVQKMEASE